MGREVVMTIKVKVNPTEVLDASKAVDMMNEVCCQLGDGHWEGTNLYREFFQLLNFEEDKTLNTMLITLEKPDKSEIVLGEDDAWEREGDRFTWFDEYIDYYIVATESWGMLDRDYKLKDATREEVIDYVIAVMDDIISNHGDEVRSLTQYRGRMLEELISALKKARDSKPVKVKKVKK
jgi:hypothetical protein